MGFDTAVIKDEHDAMVRFDHTHIVAALLALDGDGLRERVDALVDAYLEGCGGKHTASLRTALADEFLTAAPFTEQSYWIWRRIMRDDTYLPELPPRVPSELLLPPVEFSRQAM
jgi:hypothetical protein